MKKTALFLGIVLILSSCGASRKAQTTTGSNNDKVIIGISRNGIPDSKRENFAKCIHDAGAEVYFFPSYPTDDKTVEEYLDRVDCLIIPGTGKDDTLGRAQIDSNIVRHAMARKMPLLGICEGHQRINKVLGGRIVKVKEYYPGSTVKHKIVINGENVGAVSEAHSVAIDKNSTLYRIFGEEKMMVNTSHEYCIVDVPKKLKIIATSDDGLVEAYEAENILGLQFHPEYMYGNMGLTKFLKVFEYFAGEGRRYRDSKAGR